MNRKVLAIPGLLLTTFTLAACGGGASTDDAPVEGVPVVVYSGRSEGLVAPLFAEFTAQTGIPVEVRYGDTAELAAQIIEEGDASPADLFFGQDAGALGALDSAGLCAPLPAGALDAVPARYRAESGNWTGVTGRSRVIAYDSSRVRADEVPTSVLELTDPKWKGEVAIAPTNGSFQAFVTAMRVNLGEKATRAWLQGMIENDAQIFEKNSLIRDAVNAGQVKLGLINHYYWYEKAAEVGEDAMNVQIAFTAPGDPGSLVNVAGACILASSGNPGGAGEFVRWVLSPEEQEWFVAQSWEYPLIEGVSAAPGLPPIELLQGPDVPLAELEDLPGTLAMLQEVGLT